MSTNRGDSNNVTVIDPENISQRSIDSSSSYIHLDSILSKKQIKQWRENGYLLLDNIFNVDIVQNAVKEIHDRVQSSSTSDFTSIGGPDALEFPTGMSSLDSLSIDRSLITIVKELLNTNEVLLTQAETWKKVGIDPEISSDSSTSSGSSSSSGVIDNTFNNQDQRMHMDFPNHTILHPPPFHLPEAVACIIYLSNSDECGGATHIVPRLSEDDELYQWPYSNMPGFGAIPWINDRTLAEGYLNDHYPEVAAFRKALYDREVGITFKIGTLLVYRHDLWHRGTPLLPTSTRYVQNIVYKLPHCHWLHNWNQGAAKYIYEKKKYVERLIAQLDVNQRSCLGIPLPGHVYWTKLTIAAVEKRYGCFGMDMSPYLQALSNQNSDVYPTDIV